MAKKQTTKPVNGRRVALKPAIQSACCFVIMPFGGWADGYYDAIYQPAIEAAGLRAHRADDLYRPSTIVNDIWAYTRKAKLLIADLTGKNPNVFYELGLAHALAKPAILVAESIDDIPFDLRALRVILYNKNAPSWGPILQAKIEAAIREVLSAPQEAVLPAFLHIRETSGAPKVSPREKDIIEIKQELDLLRREVRRRPSDEAPETVPVSADEARELIRKYMLTGLPFNVIESWLVARGVPRTFAVREMREIAREARGTAPKPSRDTAPSGTASKADGAKAIG
ncbi:hypothetical protein GCM10011487_12710 [Steroidobacter agaridevorans]|uniref:Nucleoside 2-deoxyribosyltransferase n=1 Tax=Steroidobacter agaridevorans TaxID=2695856 RepID=A0A829Y8H3_9GAMM|nr:hypothetical protein [Steroidobacter agaridevorans]GFE79271.1 hypothetical protein GCM10011487_12710 [Steroidobacter agaridevorans]GFE88281.1 hypothetical protein GCM10011488_32350 [Steroidobacter agaridevorans]